MSAARPLRCWTELQQAALCDVVRDGVERWCHAWDVAAPVEITLEHPPWTDDVSSAWCALTETHNADAGAWLGWHVERLRHADACPVKTDVPHEEIPPAQEAIFLAHMQRLLYGVEANGVPHDMVIAVARAAWHELLNSVRNACRLLHIGASPDASMPSAQTAGMPSTSSSSSTPAATHGQRWSGAIRIRVTFAEGLTACLQLGATHIAACVPARDMRQISAATRPALTSIPDAMTQQPVRLRVRLAPVALTLGDLTSLQPGNLIPLPHALSQPLVVEADDGRALCHGHLVATHGRKAVAVVPLPQFQELS